MFKLVDTQGLPLDIIVMELREKGLGFDVTEFIGAAKKAGWKEKRVSWMLKTSMKNEEGVGLLEKTIRHIYSTGAQSAMRGLYSSMIANRSDSFITK